MLGAEPGKKHQSRRTQPQTQPGAQHKQSHWQKHEPAVPRCCFAFCSPRFWLGFHPSGCATLGGAELWHVQVSAGRDFLGTSIKHTAELVWNTQQQHQSGHVQVFFGEIWIKWDSGPLEIDRIWLWRVWDEARAAATLRLRETGSQWSNLYC